MRCPKHSSPCSHGRWRCTQAFSKHTDHHVGRLVDALDDLGVLDDTLVYYIIGDNEASAEGTVNGTFNEYFSLNGATALETVEMMAGNIDAFGHS